MDFMSYFGTTAFRQWFAQFVTVLFLVGGFAMLAVGLGLIFNGAATLRFFASMNRWVSTRQSYRAVEIPRDTRQAVLRYRRWLAVIFVAGGVFAVIGLLTRFETRAAIALFGLGMLRPAFAGWVVESARWILIVGNLAGIAIGVMLAFFPAAVTALEARGAQWYSERKLVKNRELMNLTLDKWVAQFPRASGCVITFFAMVLIGAFGLLLPALR